MITKYIVTFVLTLGLLSASAQEKTTYRIIKSDGVENIEVYHQALQSKDLDAHRLINQSRVIKFESGVEVELYSATYLEEEYGRMRNHEFMQRMGNEPVYPWYWTLSPSGTIIDKRINEVNQ